MRRFFAWLRRWLARVLGRVPAPAPDIAPTQPNDIATETRRRTRFPLTAKLVYSLVVAVLIPLWWRQYGPSNFLWFSDLAFLGAMIALWLENRLLVSMIALAALLPELGWNISFFTRLLGGPDVMGLADYMFDSSIPGLTRALSLFHVALPPLVVWMLFRLGYDRRALPAQSVVTWLTLPLSYHYATPKNNINWTLGFGRSAPQTWMPGWLWVILLMAGFPLLIYLPTHIGLNALFGRRAL